MYIIYITNPTPKTQEKTYIYPISITVLKKRFKTCCPNRLTVTHRFAFAALAPQHGSRELSILQ